MPDHRSAANFYLNKKIPNLTKRSTASQRTVLFTLQKAEGTLEVS